MTVKKAGWNPCSERNFSLDKRLLNWETIGFYDCPFSEILWYNKIAGYANPEKLDLVARK